MAEPKCVKVFLYLAYNEKAEEKCLHIKVGGTSGNPYYVKPRVLGNVMFVVNKNIRKLHLGKRCFNTINHGNCRTVGCEYSHIVCFDDCGKLDAAGRSRYCNFHNFTRMCYYNKVPNAITVRILRMIKLIVYQKDDDDGRKTYVFQRRFKYTKSDPMVIEYDPENTDIENTDIENTSIDSDYERIEQLQKENVNLLKRLDECTAENTNLKNQITELKNNLAKYEKDTKDPDNLDDV